MYKSWYMSKKKFRTKVFYYTLYFKSISFLVWALKMHKPLEKVNLGCWEISFPMSISFLVWATDFLIFCSTYGLFFFLFCTKGHFIITITKTFDTVANDHTVVYHCTGYCEPWTIPFLFLNLCICTKLEHGIKKLHSPTFSPSWF